MNIYAVMFLALMSLSFIQCLLIGFGKIKPPLRTESEWVVRAFIFPMTHIFLVYMMGGFTQ